MKSTLLTFEKSRKLDVPESSWKFVFLFPNSQITPATTSRLRVSCCPLNPFRLMGRCSPVNVSASDPDPCSS